MLISDLFEETIFSLSSNKSRSALTILGIVIGIASVIAMISVGQGTAAGITERVESLGTNLLVIMPGSQKQSGAGNIVKGGMGSATTLQTDDAEAIKNEVMEIDAVAPTVSSRKQVTVKGQNTNTSIYGIDGNYFKIKNIEIEIGSSLTDQHIKSKSKVAILGPTTRDDLFGENTDPTGQKIRISGQEYSVIGVTKAKGGTGMGSSDDLIYIPLSTAQQYITGSQAVSNINIQVSEADLMTYVQEQITVLLLARHKISDSTKADFSIMNQADMLETMSSIADTLTILLGSIAGISLVVGGIGIMNMMLTTVTERTREIGLRKSLGAKRRDISSQFLVESVTLTFISGIIGIIVGWLAAWLISKFGDTTTTVTLYSVLLSVGMSALIGIVFGYYPARRAAKMDPIEALRYQ
ncbi:MAG: multidrug ABC transporter substrate-binding protein [Candidatus Magasanikbacteria bacterium CG10_big_fil_rev_8_21_14_0_10_36_32]|uniref:Multidrug ABC transporter substrate-binding protein n=1 Tax=Candidatus Magasanikbacteria bacterium CG10_big_fil_rev_8_21_14_0_10_36_32 TaxID=1974646 RepID=A0A2M6W608_9BACT|nr:MAG: multidrug ABC transporter substrate-binding protein [Candidatus Magasanikbacteria bacterium CG10_big_fil_rev_8_21_14_0_10_36_32]